MYTDPSGEIGLLGVAAAGFAVSSLYNLGLQVVSSVKQGNSVGQALKTVDYKEVVASGVGGAVFGTVMAPLSVFSPAAQIVAAGGAGVVSGVAEKTTYSLLSSLSGDKPAPWFSTKEEKANFYNSKLISGMVGGYLNVLTQPVTSPFMEGMPQINTSYGAKSPLNPLGFTITTTGGSQGTTIVGQTICRDIFRNLASTTYDFGTEFAQGKIEDIIYQSE